MHLQRSREIYDTLPKPSHLERPHTRRDVKRTARVYAGISKSDTRFWQICDRFFLRTRIVVAAITTRSPGKPGRFVACDCSGDRAHQRRRRIARSDALINPSAAADA